MYVIILKPLPYGTLDRLIMVWSVNEKEGFTGDEMRHEGISMSDAEFLDWQEKSGFPRKPAQSDHCLEAPVGRLLNAESAIEIACS